MDPIPSIIRAVKAELKHALIGYTAVLPPTLIEIGKVALSGPGKVLSAQEDDASLLSNPPRWPLAVLLSYWAASEQAQKAGWREALPAVIAVEIAMSAADLIDEISDDDPSIVITRYGPGQALNTANLMLVMAQQILLKHAVSTNGERRERLLAALVALQDMLVEAAVGQHLDMLYEKLGPTEVTIEMSADMTQKKAGALISGACLMGALMSGAPPQIVQLIARFGRDIGSIAQINNDLRDVQPGTVQQTPHGLSQPKTDLRLRKRTIPITFSLHDDSPEPNLLQKTFSDQTQHSDEEELRHIVESTGGLHFADLLIDIHRQNASQTLDELASLRPGANSILSSLLHSLDPSSD